MAEISIIIISYNRPGDTIDLLDSITRLKDRDLFLREILLVNNASTEDYSLVESYLISKPDLPVKYLLAPGNLGVAGGRNFAVKHSSGKWMLFLDDDVIIEDPEFLSKLNKSYSIPFTEDRLLGVLGIKVRYFDNREIQVNAFPHKNFEKYRDKPRFLTSYFVGCAHVILREAWDKSGEYPSDFFYGMEEYDLSYRILKMGYCIGYDGSAELFHKESPLGRTPRPVQVSMMWVNKSKVAWKYLPVRYFITTSFLWAGFYLKKSGYNLRFFFSSIRKILRIPVKEKRNQVSDEVMQYLKEVGARPWF